MSYLDPATRRAAIYGYRLVLRDSFDSDDIPGNPLGWTDHRNRICYVFTDRFDIFTPLSTKLKAILKVALHEVGHARWRNVRRTPNYWRYVRGGWLGTDQQVEEDYCETYSYYIWQKENTWGQTVVQAGISYSFRSPVPTANRIMTVLGRAL